MYLPIPEHSSQNSFFERCLTSRLDRLKVGRNPSELKLIVQADAILSNNESRSQQKNQAFGELLGLFVNLHHSEEWHLPHLIEYLLEKIPTYALIEEHRIRLVGTICIFCHRFYREQMDCVIYEDFITYFAKLLKTYETVHEWEDATIQALNLISIDFENDFESILQFMQMGVDLIFYGRKEHRELVHEGVKSLIKAKIEKKLCFSVARLVSNRQLGLALCQVYISRQHIMVYTKNEVDLVLNLMIACECSLYSVLNMKAMLNPNSMENTEIQMSFYHASLDAAKNIRVASLSDIENIFALIHQHFNRTNVNRITRLKLLNVFRKIMLDCALLGSRYSEEDISKIYSEFIQVFQVNLSWLQEAKEVLYHYYKQVRGYDHFDFNTCIWSCHIIANVLLGDERFNPQKLVPLTTTLLIDLAVRISGANFETAINEPFDSKHIIQLVEEAIEGFGPETETSLKLLLKNRRLTNRGSISILEALLEAQKGNIAELLVHVIDKIYVRRPLTLTEYIRILKMLLNPQVCSDKTLRQNRELLAKFVSSKWDFDSIFSDFNASLIHHDQMNHYFGEMRNLVTIFIREYQLSGLVDDMEIAANVVESITAKILMLRNFKLHPVFLRQRVMISVKRELLNLLHEYCKVIDVLRVERRHEKKANSGTYFMHLYERPLQCLHRLENMRLNASATNEPLITMTDGKFFLNHYGMDYPLLSTSKLDKEKV